MKRLKKKEKKNFINNVKQHQMKNKEIKIEIDNNNNSNKNSKTNLIYYIKMKENILNP